MQGYEINAISAPRMNSFGKPVTTLGRKSTPATEETTRFEMPGSGAAAVVSLSPEARSLSNGQEASGASATEEEQSNQTSQSPSSDNELSLEEEKQVTELKSRDSEVRAHEQAHRSAGGQYTGAAQYEYATGPDGKRYAINGEVSIDISAVPDNPEATVQKMEVVKRAAMAPAQPSGADRAVHSQASRLQAQAQIEARQVKTEESQESRESSANDVSEEPESTEKGAGSAMQSGVDRKNLGFSGFVAI